MSEDEENRVLAAARHGFGEVVLVVEYAHDFGDWTARVRGSHVVSVTGAASAREALMEAGWLVGGREAMAAHIERVLAR